MRLSREAAAAAALAAGALAFLLPMWAQGLTPFWGDLTYLHHPWRASPAQLVQAGRAPLWEPSLYLGMPMLASMQGALLYPLTASFFFFDFVDALAVFHALHYFLAGWLCALWLRSLGLRWGPCAAAGLGFALGGLMIARVHFLNHLAVLSWMPAAALLFRRPAALAGALSLIFLAGYPTCVPGVAAAAWGLAWALRARGSGSPVEWAAAWAWAGALSLALTAAQFLPALELAALSRRSGGVGLEEALTWGFTLGDLRQWLSPALVPLSAFRPEVEWTRCVYLGAAAWGAIAAGAAGLPRRRAAALGLLLAVVVVLILGGSNPLSRALWTHLAPLRFVRYPGNLAYLALLPLAALCACGLSRLRWAPALSLLLLAELLIWGWVSTPTAPRGLFAEAGPLARRLQATLDGTRYLISPKALESSSGEGLVDWKTRLYGLTNAPYRLRAVGNFGEPLTFAPSYRFMDMLYSAKGADKAAAWMPWAGASVLLTPVPPPPTPLLRPEGRALWHVSRAAREIALAQKLTPAAGDGLPAGLPEAAPAPGAPLRVARAREDRFGVSGEGAGWVFVSEPLYPGWEVRLDGGIPERRPALGPFQKVRVPEGAWTLRFFYDPLSWRLGVLLSAAALLALAGYWYHRASRLEFVKEHVT